MTAQWNQILKGLKYMNELDIKSIIIETERLILRPFKPEDLDDLYEYAKNPNRSERRVEAAREHRGKQSNTRPLYQRKRGVGYYG